MALIPVRKISAAEENFRVGHQMVRRDPVEPVPVGSFVVMVFQVDGYDQDCDGSLMARLSNVDKDGATTGWKADAIGLYPDTTLQATHPSELWKMIEWRRFAYGRRIS